MSFLLLAGVLAYAWFLVRSANLDLLTVESKRLQDWSLQLEADSLIKKDHLESYLLFSGQSLNQDDAKKLKSFSPLPKTWLLSESLFLPLPLENDCPHIYCFQHRLPFSEIPSNLWKSLIGIEDIRYLNHQGVDLKSIIRALLVDLKEGRLVQGGSTLTMQLVKNLFLTNEKTFTRKFKEAIYAIYIESKYSKEEIINAYLNEFIWGGLQGIKVKGFMAASLFYFQKNPQLLSDYEISLLVALLKGPNYFHPLRQSARLRKRADYVYASLQEKNLTSPGGKWSDSQWEKWINILKGLEAEKPFFALWRAQKNKNGTFNIFENYVFEKATIDVFELLKNRIKDADIGMKAMIGRLDCLKQDNCFTFYSKYERNKANSLKKERHQIGSIFKPLIYDIFLQADRNLEEMIEAGPLTLEIKSGPWEVGEDYELEQNQIALKDALLLSRNRPLIRLARDIGFDIVQEYLEEYQISSLRKPLGEYPSQLIGSLELSLHEAFQIFSTFIQKQCQIFYELDNRDSPFSFERSLLHLLSDPRKTTLRKVVSPQLANYRFFGKTGTTNNGLDNWFAYFDGVNLGLIWMGLEGNRENQKLRLSGSGSSFRVFQNFILHHGKQVSELSCVAVRQ